MNREYFWGEVNARIREVVGTAFSGQPVRSVGGGCINQATCLADGKRRFFIKYNDATALPSFEAEAAGLAALAATNTIRVPEPVCAGLAGDRAFLALEWLDLVAANRLGPARLGEDLGRLHTHPAGRLFGWERDNTIGATPQVNTQTEDWPAFYGEHRLAYQFHLAVRRGGSFPRRQALLEKVPELLCDRVVKPSWLHGDLWSGNMGFTRAGEPVIFDPAVYRGDPEADLAMTELFGGFGPAFYEAYAAQLAQADGYPMRRTLYNLYHVLNHFNLFGGHYAAQANQMIDELLGN